MYEHRLRFRVQDGSKTIEEVHFSDNRNQAFQTFEHWKDRCERQWLYHIEENSKILIAYRKNNS